MSVDVRVYLVTGEVGPGRSLAEVVAGAVAGGVTLVQLRDKTGDAEAVSATATTLRDSLDRSGVPLLVNDDPPTVTRSGAAGVHLGPGDLHPRKARDLLGPEAVIGWSIHSVAQLDDAAAVEACDYVAASPVWATPTKTDTTPPLGLEGLAILRARLPSNSALVGIGGIDETNAASVIAAGADGVAVVSAICAAADPTAATRRLRAVVDEALAHGSSR